MKIGLFDSGYGGLTILEKCRKLMPEYDYIYLGDNARAPYGSRSFDIVYQFTRQAVKTLFDMGCHLVILACNTASAKALRTIQQNDLPIWGPERRVLGIIRPTVEIIGGMTKTRHVGILATVGTIHSDSYRLEIEKLCPDVTVTGEACPLWVPIVENNECDTDGAGFFVKKNLDNLFGKDPKIDTIILGCTHYPLLMDKIKQYVPENVTVLPQGEYVARSLKEYLTRHPEIESCCSKQASCEYFTTENPEKFRESAWIFIHEDIKVGKLQLDTLWKGIE